MTYLIELIPYISMLFVLCVLYFVMSILSIRKEKRYLSYPLVLLSPIILTVLSVLCYRLMRVIDFAGTFLSSIMNGSFMIVGWNALLFIVYMIIRSIINGILSARGEVPDMLAENCRNYYTLDEEYHLYFFNEDHINFRRIINALTVFTIVFTAGLLTYIAMHPGGQDYAYRIFPIAAMLVIAEVELFLSGYIKQEYCDHIGGKAITSSVYSNYSRLRQVYEKLLPEDLLKAHTGNEFQAKDGASDFINSLEKSDDEADRIAAAYFDSLEARNGLFDVDLIELTLNLLHGKSAVVMNPFYRDLSDYILLPVVDQLVNHRNCLIIVGRNSIADDAMEWIRGVLKGYCRTERLWRVGMLENRKPDCEVGMLSFSQLYDFDVVRENREFLENTGFVLLLEPSRMLTTSQTGLANLADIINSKRTPVYCISDHDADGLADTLSHVLKVNITDVSSAPRPHSIYTILGWDASGDYQRQRMFGKEVHYLGNGIEIASVALKNQVPHVSWYSESKAPIKDIRWIAGQYYPQICRYAGIVQQQKSIDDYITFSSDLWGSEVVPNEFVIVEDEFCNLFSSARAYLSRGFNQTFVNVITENYLLRDYMRYNCEMFISDHKAIPAISSAYVKSERNTVHRLILKMAAAPVPESEIIHELSLINIKTDDIYDTLTKLITKYSVDVQNDAIITVEQKSGLSRDLEPIIKNFYSISNKTFIRHFRRTLRNAYFVVEDEVEGRENIDARLYEHVTQIVMPGQLIIHDGKLYRVQSVNPDECILHRASDHYAGRRYYKQNRTYTFSANAETEHVRRVMDIEISRERRDFKVTSSGYFDMEEYGNLRSARYVDLSDDPSMKEYDRRYRNKNVLRIKMSGTTEKERYTTSVLLTELFRSLFPEAIDYIAVLSRVPETVTGILRNFSYTLEGAYDDESIYIVEDSDMDIGLIEAVDQNIMRIFEILADYIDWHEEQFRKQKEEPKPLPAVQLPEDKKIPGVEGFFRRLIEAIKRLFRKKEKEPQQPAGVTPAAPAGNTGGIVVTDQVEEDVEIPVEYVPERDVQEPAEPVFTQNDGAPDDIEILLPADETDYQRRCYLKFGFEEIDANFDLFNLRVYLNKHGWTNNAITKSRHREPIPEHMLDIGAVETCDFCGKPLSGVNYEKLADGRVRCNECSRTAIDNVEDFQELAMRTKAMMESIYNISYTKAITIQIADAKVVAKQSGMLFKPTPGYDGRVLGFARKKNGQFSILMENGAPRLASIETFAHEMTHIWQYENWEEKDGRQKIVKLYGSEMNRKIVYEGMATWSACQMLYAMGETAYAEQNEAEMAMRQDEYGVGFRLFREKYGFVKNGDIPPNTPFNHFPPL